MTHDERGATGGAGTRAGRMDHGTGTQTIARDAEEHRDPIGAAAGVLSPRHLADLAGSGIDEATAVDHGFRSVTTRDDLIEIGFPEPQAKKLVKNLPALALPSWNPDGTLAGYQIKLDRPPLVGGKGRKRPIRYATPDGAANVLDFGRHVSPELLGDPHCPVVIVEGVKKAVKLRHALALAGRKGVVVALLGVWGWKHTSERGGRIAHPFLVGGSLALNSNRLIIVAFDSDVWSCAPGATASRAVPSSSARNAAVKLAKLLRAYGATVRFLVLPPLEDGKQGVDDFLTGGGSLEEFQDLITDEPPQETNEPDEWAGPPHHPYREHDGGTYYLKHTESGGHVPILLANFTARIVRETALDDGAERAAHYETELRCSGRVIHDRVMASRFAGLGWISCAGAIVTPGQACRDHLRAAIQHLSAPVDSTVAYTHTGWRLLDGIGWTYLHAGGGVGPIGPVPEVQTLLADLPHYLLPDPPTGDDLREAVRASLRVLEVAPHRVTAPIVGAIYRAPLGSVTASVFVAGGTGRRKTAMVALAQQHFGAAMDAEHLPGNWTSTENALEAQCFRAADAVMTIDDFCPAGSVVDHARHHARAARIFRATGNHSARGRMRADRSLDPERAPRCLVIATGEDVPRGQSIRARMFVVEVEKDDVDLGLLTQCQADAASGLFAASLSGYVRRLAARLDDVRSRLPEIHRELRAAASGIGGHSRVAANLAELATGIGFFLEYAVDVEAIALADAEEKFAAAWKALVAGACAAAPYLEGSDAATRYLELLASAITSGEAHLSDERTGGAPSVDEAAHGWRRENDSVVWRTPPSSRHVGWTTGDEVWLDPDAAFAAVTTLAVRQGDPFAVTEGTIRKRLHEARRLRRVDSEADGSLRYAVRETPRAIKSRKRVLVLEPLRSWFTGPIGPTVKSAIPQGSPRWPGFGPNVGGHNRATTDGTGPRHGQETTDAWPGTTGPANRTASPQKMPGDTERATRGPIGPVYPASEGTNDRCNGCGADIPDGSTECRDCWIARTEVTP